MGTIPIDAVTGVAELAERFSDIDFLTCLDGDRG